MSGVPVGVPTPDADAILADRVVSLLEREERNGALRDRMIGLLGAVNEWLKFAETKNTTGLTLGSAALAVLTGYDTPWRGWLAVGWACSFVLLIGCVGMATLSFLPKTAIERPRQARVPGEGDNLMFYGHLAEYDHRELVRSIQRRYFGADLDTPDRFSEDVALQIVSNSAIIVRKLRLFRWSVLLFALGTVIGLVTAALGRMG
ncbi:MAG: Pycsar system effector family protein [Thermomicrobiales bacterium]